VQLSPRQLLPHTAALLQQVLPCLGHAGELGAGGQGAREISTAVWQAGAISCVVLPHLCLP